MHQYSRLTTVTVQTGFRREDFYVQQCRQTSPQPARNLLNTRRLDLTTTVKGKKQGGCPGIEYMGEGIFIRLENDDGWQPPLSGRSFDSWSRRLRHDSGQIQRTICSETIRTPKSSHASRVCLVAYPLTPAYQDNRRGRRIFIRGNTRKESTWNSTEDTGRARGGILLYSYPCQARRGRMGGLIALVPYFDRMLRMAFRPGSMYVPATHCVSKTDSCTTLTRQMSTGLRATAAL